MAPRRPKTPLIRPSVAFPAHVLAFFESLTQGRPIAGPDDDYETILVGSFSEEPTDTARYEPFVFMKVFAFENMVRDIDLMLKAFQEAHFKTVDATTFQNTFDSEGPFGGVWIFQNPRACLIGKFDWTVPDYVDDECDASAVVTIAWAPTEPFARAHFPQLLSTWYRDSLVHHVEPLKDLIPCSPYSDGFLLGQLLRDTIGASLQDPAQKDRFLQTIIRGMQSPAS